MKIKSIKMVLIIIVMISFVMAPFSMAETMIENKTDVAEIETMVEEDIFKDITAPNLILAETNSDRIFYERKADEKIYPASVTKLMTAILVVENCKLEDKVIVSKNAVQSVPYGYVNANLKVGEQLTVKDLLYALLLPSANDAANSLAEHVGGSIDNFAIMMNEKATALGCTNTHFTNPSGLHEKEHYTTTKDLLYIARKAISNPTIKKIMEATKYTLPRTNQYSKIDRILTTTNYMKRKELKKYYYDYCIGGKTGYTGQAKNCVVEFIEKDGIELTAIVMGEDAKIKGKKFLDAKKMAEYIFTNYEKKRVAIENQQYETITIINGTKDTRKLEVVYKDNLTILTKKVKETDEETIKTKVEYQKTKAPIQKGEVVGTITHEYDGIKYSTQLKAGSNVEESKLLEQTLIMGIVGLIVIIVIIYIMKKSNRNDLKKLNKSYQRKNKKR